MTDLLEDAISRLRKLPATDQDLAAKAIFSIINQWEPEYRLTPEQVEEVRGIQAGLLDGTTRLATDEEVEEMWRRLGA